MKLSPHTIRIFLTWCLITISGCSSTDTSTLSTLSVDDKRTAIQYPGDVFLWPADITLTSLDECVLALPAVILNEDDPIGDMIVGDDDMGFSMPQGDENIYLRLEPDMSVTIRRSCQALICGDDDKPRRFKVGNAND